MGIIRKKEEGMAYDYDDYEEDVEDVDDDMPDEEEEEGEDLEHPFGEDEGEGAQPPQTDEQEGEEEDVKSEDVEEGKKKKKDPWDPEITKALAQRYSMPDIIFKMPCPKCKKKTLFLEKPIPTGVRAAIYITGGIFGVIPMDKCLSIPHFRCLNSRCTSFWPSTGKYFTFTPTGVMEEHNKLFHINL